jgi:hypothetical protein
MLLARAFALGAEHGFGAAVAVRDFNADPSALVVRAGAAELLVVLADVDSNVSR